MADATIERTNRRVRDRGTVPDGPLDGSLTERVRLIDQGGELVFTPLTRRLFVEAGLRRGMRVLDVGCGAGDVAFLAAELVGAEGEVVGVDRDAWALATARDRATIADLANVSFVEGDFREVDLPGSFDALVGRFILMSQSDPAAAIRALRPRLRPGAIVAFQELDLHDLVAVPPQPLVTQVLDWWHATLVHIGVEQRMGPKLYATFRAAGLPAPAMIAEALIGDGAESPVPTILADVIRAILPDAERFGVVTRAEVDVETLADRLRAEVVAGGGCIASPLLVGAWTRTH